MPDRTSELFPEAARRPAGTGVLPSQAIRHLIRSGRIQSLVPVEEAQIQPSSLDLRISAKAYRLDASFLPGRGFTVEQKLGLLGAREIDLSAGAILERGVVYLVPLLEHLELPAGIWAKANPKSTTGRLDLFTRVIADYGEEFERVPEGYAGPLYAEVVPRAFSVVVRQGMRLTQIRFVRGTPPSPDTVLQELHDEEVLVYDDDDSPVDPVIKQGLKISVRVAPSADSDIVGYRAKRSVPVVDLGNVDYYDPAEFWEPIPASRERRILLEPGAFYILASREKIRVPPRFAAEMVPFDPAVGEFRIHYAGFFDPGFGYGLKEIRGTRAVLEVRAHDVPFVLEDGQIVGRLLYGRLLELPDKVYGVDIGSSYQRQELALAKQFRRQPARVRVGP